MTIPSTIRPGLPPSMPRYEEYSPFERSGVSIALRYRAELIGVLGAISGVLSTICFLWGMNHSELLFMAGPGALFGILVLLPWCRFCRIAWWQTFPAVVLAPIGYAVAVRLTLSMTWLMPFGALIGCAIMFVPVFLVSQPRIRFAVFIALGVGGILGVAMPALAWLGGFVLWQYAVAYSLGSALQVEDA